jgi:short-subunit dehydrogenase
MKKNYQKVILITGASTGIGCACARYLSRQGYVVFGTSRTLKEQQLPYHLVQMDVTDLQSVKKGVDEICNRAGNIDVVINNAGIGIAGAVTDTSVEEAQQQFDTNFFGVMRVCQEVIPRMRAQQHGLIINMSSLAGLVSVPYQGLYSASKFALEGVSQAMRMELAPYNIKVVLINPGDFKTSFTANRHIIQKYLHTPHRQFTKTLEIITKDEQRGSSPEKIGRLVEKIIEKKRPKTNYLVGSPAEIVFAKLVGILPAGIKEKILADHYKIEG